MSQPLAGLGRLVADVDVFILDLWGVVHGGVEPFAGVVATLEAIRAAGKPVVFVSNAPVRSHHVAGQLDRMGLASLYDALLTSGEATWRHLSERHVGARYFGIGPRWAKLLHEDLPHEAVGSVDAADLLLVVGMTEERPLPGDYAAELEAALARDLPLVCANPDRVIVVQDGTYSWCAGAIADVYAAMGGRVEWLGKPDPAIFAEAAAIAGVSAPERALIVGDGLPTDIAGANAFGAPSVLITRGIHARDLALVPGDEAAPEALAALLASHAARPDYVMGTLRW